MPLFIRFQSMIPRATVGRDWLSEILALAGYQQAIKAKTCIGEGTSDQLINHQRGLLVFG